MLCQRSATGVWRTIAVSESELSSIVTVSGEIYVGTDDAQVLRLGASGNLERVLGFARMPGRDKWYAGTALVDGNLLGPPLGVRSMTATWIAERDKSFPGRSV